MAKQARPTLEADERADKGSRATRRLRREGFVPGIVYGGSGGNGNGARSFKADARALRTALHGGSAVLDLKIGGGTAIPVIVKDQQNHPVRGEVLHIDLLEVNLNETIQAPVSIELVNAEEAPGVKEGGVLEQVARELNIEALPTDIPENITVDVSHLETAGTMTLAEVTSQRIDRWQLGKPKKRYAGLFADGRTMPGGPSVAVLLPQTFMNDAGRSAGPARGALRVPLDRIVVVHDKIDLPFGEVRTR